ncbi:hypothetical protein BH11ACT5_BH11ACT5_00720 [soil metagenome]
MDAAALDLARVARPPQGVLTTILAIDGLSGAGKSTLAAALGDELSATLVHTDDFSRWDLPLDWWPRMLEQVLLPLAHGQDARFQRWDWERGQLAEWHTVPAGGTVIVEGVSSSREVFRRYLAASVWVDTPRDLRLARGLERDGQQAAPLWAAWMAAEDAWVALENPRASASLIVEGF